MLTYPKYAPLSSLALRKNSLTAYNFIIRLILIHLNCLGCLFSHKPSASEMLTYPKYAPLSSLALRKNSLTAYNFIFLAISP